MNFTAEQMKKINTAKSAEELIELAKAEGIEMSEEKIKAKFAEMHTEGAVADDELDNVTGGCFESTIDEYIGRTVRITSTGECGVIESWYNYRQYHTHFTVKFDDGTTKNYGYEDVEFL